MRRSFPHAHLDPSQCGTAYLSAAAGFLARQKCCHSTGVIHGSIDCRAHTPTALEAACPLSRPCARVHGHSRRSADTARRRTRCDRRVVARLEDSAPAFAGIGSHCCNDKALSRAATRTTAYFRTSRRRDSCHELRRQRSRQPARCDCRGRQRPDDRPHRDRLQHDHTDDRRHLDRSGKSDPAGTRGEQFAIDGNNLYSLRHYKPPAARSRSMTSRSRTAGDRSASPTMSRRKAAASIRTARCRFRTRG